MNCKQNEKSPRILSGGSFCILVIRVSIKKRFVYPIWVLYIQRKYR